MALDWIRNYKRSDLKGDVSAGLTVGVMLIPQGMAYAMIAGLPPIYGLYASTIPLIIYALFGSSRQLAVGPVAMVSLLTAAGVGAIASTGSENYIQLAILLALMVGVIQLGLGVLRLGFLVNFLSHPVISGFTSAAALIIGLSQLKHLMGVDIPRSHFVHEILIDAVSKIGETNLVTLLVGLGGIVLILWLKKSKPALPAHLFAVLLSVLAVWMLDLDSMGVDIVGEIPSGLPAFAVPAFDYEHFRALIPAALVIAVVSFMESIAVAKAVQSRHRNYKVDPNTELRALGLANIGGSIFQAYPTTGGFSRTAVNDRAGARTGLASVISALLIILTLLFLTPLFFYLPLAILASVIMVAVFGLIDIKEVFYLWKTNKSDFAMLLVTFIATLGLGIEQGIGVGVLVSLGVVIYRTTRPHMAKLGQVPGTPFYRNVKRFEDLIERKDILIVRFDSQLYYANLNYFRESMDKMVDEMGDELKLVLMDAESMNYVDSSALHALEEWFETLATRDIQLYFADVKGPVRDAMKRAGLVEKIGNEYFFISIHEAVEYWDAISRNEDKDRLFGRYTLQTND